MGAAQAKGVANPGARAGAKEAAEPFTVLPAEATAMGAAEDEGATKPAAKAGVSCRRPRRQRLARGSPSKPRAMASSPSKGARIASEAEGATTLPANAGAKGAAKDEGAVIVPPRAARGTAVSARH